MAAKKIAITVEADMLAGVDEMVRRRAYPNRSRAIQAAIHDKLERYRRVRLAREARKLSPQEERKTADEGLPPKRNEWPGY